MEGRQSEHMKARQRLRQIVTVLAWISLGSVPLALADPPAPNATAAAASSTSSPTQPPNSAETSSTATAAVPAGPSAASSSDVDPREKQLLHMGFKPSMQHGQKVFCKREQQLGSRVSGTMVCGTVDQLENQFRLSREAVEQTQRSAINPQGH